jgi:hypothetical protein
VLGGLLTRPFRRRAERRDTFRTWRSACAEANETYVLWAANPTRETYSSYLAAERRASRAGLLLARRPPGVGPDTEVAQG